MKRRDFLSGSYTERIRRDINFLGEEPKIEGNFSVETKPLDRQMAYHLLRRFAFGPTPEMVDEFVGLSPQEAADKILGDGTKPLPDGYQDLSWLDTQEEDPLKVSNQQIRSEIMSKLNNRYAALVDWWLEQMREESLPVMEKLALFWSTVWCIEFTYDTLAQIPPPLLYRNNQLLREQRLGNYKDFALEMTLDGAMLLYQSLYYSTKDAPNENYPRELLELFTMGIGHYSEGDIQVASTMLTGWRTAAYLHEPAPNGKFNTYFVPGQHATGTSGRTFMGNTIPPLDEADNTEFQVKEKEVKGLLDIMFSEKGLEIGKFISEKIYRYFVYASEGDIDYSIVDNMAEVFVQNNFELKPVFRSLITSKHFYDQGAYGIQFKTPPEYIAGFEKQLGVVYPYSRRACNDLEQVLYDPPNVGSWKGYRTWISTTTLPLRIKYASEILGEASDAELIALAKKFEDYTDLILLNEKLLEYFLAKIPDETRKERYLNVMRQYVDDSYWASAIEAESSNAADAIRELIKEIIKSPDFQLC